MVKPHDKNCSPQPQELLGRIKKNEELLNPQTWGGGLRTPTRRIWQAGTFHFVILVVVIVSSSAVRDEDIMIMLGFFKKKINCIMIRVGTYIRERRI